MGRRHATAIVADGAVLADDVEVGPYCVIGPHVRIGAGTRLLAHVTVDGHTELGADNLVYPFAALGAPPQVRRPVDEGARLEIGSGNIIREHATMHAGTAAGGLVTRVGSGGLFMNNTHVAHDCSVGDHVVLVNGAQIGGHVVIDDHAQVGALTGVHQFVRIGSHAFVGGCSGVERHVIPFGLAIENRAWLRGVNLVGLQRAGFAKAAIDDVRKACNYLFSENESLRSRVANLRAQLQESEWPGAAQVETILQFCDDVDSDPKIARRGYCLPRGRPF